MKTPEHPIFLESVQYIRSQIGFTGLSSIQQAVLERIIHSSGDLRMQSCLRFSRNACENAITALQNGAKILTDTYMAKAAISPMAKRTLNSDVQCINCIFTSIRAKPQTGLHSKITACMNNAF